MLYVLPQSGTTPVVEFIRQARGPLVIENYFLDSRPVLAAIAADVRRGQTVVVLLEPRPYGISHRLVAKEYRLVRSTGAQVRNAPARFASGRNFQHAKFAVAGNEALIGTANWDWSGFHKDRDYLYVSTDKALINALQAVAIADVRDRRAGRTARDAGLVVSPGAAPALRRVIDQPGPVTIETEELQPNNPLMPALERKAASGGLRMILPGNLHGREAQAVADLKAHGAAIRTLSQPYMHAKVIVGDHLDFIGSQNFSTTSLRYNREIGVILHAGATRQALRRQVDADWSRAGGGAAPDGRVGSAVHRAIGGLRGWLSGNH